MSKKYFIQVKFKNENEIIIEWKLPEEFEPKSTDIIGLYDYKSTNQHSITYSYNFKSNLEGKISLRIEYSQIMNKKLQARYLIENKSKSILSSEVFEIITLKKPKITIEEINEKQIEIKWKLPDLYVPNGYYPEYLDREECMIGPNDTIGLFLKSSLNSNPLNSRINPYTQKSGKCTFYIEEYIKYGNDQEFEFRYVSYTQQTIAKSESFFINTKIPETNLILSKDNFLFGELIEISWEFSEEIDMPKNNSWIGLFYEKSNNLKYIEQKNITQINRKGSIYFSNGHNIQGISKPFRFQLFENEGIEIITKNPLFGFPLYIQFKLPDGYNPNILDSISLFDYNPYSNLNDLPQKPLIEKFNTSLSRFGLIDFHLDPILKKKKVETENTNENQIRSFIVKYFSHPKNSDENKMLITSSHFEVDEPKDFKLSISKNEILFGDSIDIEWEFPEYFNPNITDWIGLFLKDSPNNSFLNKQFNSTKLRKEKLKFEIGNYITDENQIFEFRYLPNNQYNLLIKSQEIKVKNFNIKDFKLSISKNEISFGDSINIEWEFPEYFNPNTTDWIGLFLKDSPNNSFLNKQYNSTKLRKEKLKFDIGNYITDENQIFEFRYLPNNQYNSLIKSQEIKVISIKGRINLSTKKSRIGDTIKISWQLPNNKELPKHFQIICKNEKCEKKAEREIKIQFGGGIIEEEFIIGYYSHYKLIICQSPIIIEPINFVGIKILNRINVGDKVQFLWSLPPIVTPLETDKFMILSLKESKPILIPNSNFIYNLSSTYSGISELEADFIREKDIIQDFVIEYIKDNEFSPIIISGIFRFEFPILSKNLQFDLLNLFLRQEFCDFTINHLDGNIQVHKLILLMRFDNDQSILTKINQILSSKTENQVIPFLIFIYTGMINPISTLDLDSFQKDEWNLIEVNHPFFSFYWKATQFNFEDSDSQELFQEYLKNPNDFSQIQNEKKIQSILQELGFDKNWIENKKDESGIKKDLVNLYLEKIEKTDFKIICDDSSEIKVHKLILISRSNLFREMFLNVQDDSNSVKDYSGKSKKSLEQLIHYFYFGEFNLNPKEDSTTIIQELKDTEDFYQLSQFNPFN